ncbi:MAG: hypothetical protein LBE60_10600 [Microbacterium sp.]|uniref:hypothetical protein n=1 Tax=Microbacterium sp. TaxID=51671 RepID=UPI0028321DFE|nr:hypothetical protein [Microbacterium sp.]MDR2322082.1 hypothetical protein [Microbacterium sp.]
MATRPPMRRSVARPVRGSGALRGAVIGLVWAYGAVFVLGMVLNLFVTLPEKHPGAGGAEYFGASGMSLIWALSLGGGWALFLHAAMGVLLALATLTVFLGSLYRGGWGWRWITGIAALFTIGAAFNGLSFLDYGEDFSSAIMAGCWLIAVGALVSGLVRSQPARDRAARGEL